MGLHRILQEEGLRVAAQKITIRFRSSGWNAAAEDFSTWLRENGYRSDLYQGHGAFGRTRMGQDDVFYVTTDNPQEVKREARRLRKLYKGESQGDRLNRWLRNT